MEKEKKTHFKSDGRGRSGVLSGKYLYRVGDNPRKDHVHGYHVWEEMWDGMTYEEFIMIGGRYTDLKYDVRVGRVKVLTAPVKVKAQVPAGKDPSLPIRKPKKTTKKIDRSKPKKKKVARKKAAIKDVAMVPTIDKKETPVVTPKKKSIPKIVVPPKSGNLSTIK